MSMDVNKPTSGMASPTISSGLQSRPSQSSRKNGSYHLWRWRRLKERGFILRGRVAMRGSVWDMLVLGRLLEIQGEKLSMKLKWGSRRGVQDEESSVRR